MSLRIDASGDLISRPSAVTITNFTLCGWTQVNSDRGSTTWQSLAGAQVNANAYIGWGWSTNNGTPSVMELGSWNGSVWTAVTIGTRPAVGEWFFWYLKCAGTGANQLEVGWRRLNDASYTTATTTLGSGITGAATALIGNEPNFSFWGNGRHAAIKGYSTALSATDIERERLTNMPRNTTNLLFWVPAVSATAADSIKDFSGLGANFTAGGTLTVEGGPPIQFSGGRRLQVIPVSGGAGGQTLTPSLYTDADSFFSPTVAPGAVTLTPSLFTNTNTFFAPTVAATYGLTPSLYTDADSFFAPTVAPGAVTLTPSLFTNTNTFFAPTVARGTVTLTPSLYSDADSFFAPTVAATYGLTPSLYTDVDTFFAPTVAPGTITLTPSLFTDADSFFSPTVDQAGTQTLTPALYTDADSFFAPTVTRGTVTLTPSLYTDADTFFAPTVARGTVTLTPSLYTDADTFFAPTVAATYGLTPSLYTDADTFFAPTVTGGSITLAPSLYSDADTFFSPTVTPGQRTLTPSLYTDADTFFGPTVTRNNTLAPSLYSDADSFFVPTVSPGTVTLAPALFADADTFYSPLVAEPGFQSLSPPFVADADFFPQSTITVFYGDTEVIFVGFENRRMTIPSGDRAMIIPAENTMMAVLNEPRSMKVEPRKRVY